ncbi:hypothetical protein GRI39_10560 [Altererythrobacter indicus]|uniref:Uncharacterized protein n=1 Tax=Altericroceibacterium indicum TaxID=374177 RepID=A0A845A8D5_9SPHN|nr:hypothetical protein [Altericroceibacterium indicum]MXP26480.1 hypothetical protein [Altericroceibacterium indicum]
MFVRFITLSACALAGIVCGSFPADAQDGSGETHGQYYGSWEGSWNSDGNYDGVWSGTYYRAQPADTDSAQGESSFRYPEPERSGWISECSRRFLDARSVTGSARENSPVATHVRNQCEDYLSSYEAAYSQRYAAPRSGFRDEAAKAEAEPLPDSPKIRALKRRDTAYISSQNIASSAVTYSQ